MAKRRGFPPVYKIERVAKMSVKRAFFGIFQKLTLFCCAMFFGFANAFSANLPSGYTELEYIESTGEQWIDTGYAYANEVTKTYIEFAKLETSGSNLFGCSVGDSRYITGYGVLNIYIGSGIKKYLSSLGDGTKHTLEVYTPQSVGDTGYVTYDGNQSTYTKNVGNISGANMGIFTQIDSRQQTMATDRMGAWRVYAFKMWDNNTLVRDFVPVRQNSTGKYGMYDVVNGVFYGNANTSSGAADFTAGPVVPENPIKIATTAYNSARFSPVKTDLDSAVATIREIVTKTINQTAAIASLQADKQTRPEEQCPAGKKCLLVETEENGVIVPHWFPIVENICGLPSGYTCLEYIQSSGTQYIDTGIKASLNTKAEGVFEIPSGDVGQLFGSYDDGAYFRFYVPASNLKTNIFDGVGLQTSLLPEDVSRGTKIKITLDKTGLYVGNKTFAYNGTPSAFTATSNIYIGMISSYTGTNVSKGKVYSFKLYNNGTLVRDFVPAKNSSGVIGMYDLADQNPATAFYTNSGTGTFTPGQEM